MTARSADPLAALMRRYQDDDARAFQRLYECLQPRLRATVSSITGPGAVVDDLLQVTMMRAHVARHRFILPADDADGAVVAWYVAIARNSARAWFQESQRRLVPVGSEVPTDAPELTLDPESARLTAEHEAQVIDRVQRAIEQLPAEQRQVVELHKLQDMRFTEIAQRLGVREGAVRVRAHRAYRALARRLMRQPSRGST